MSALARTFIHIIALFVPSRIYICVCTHVSRETEGERLMALLCRRIIAERLGSQLKFTNTVILLSYMRERIALSLLRLTNSIMVT